jgi:filamentous hemagglutinin
MVWARNDQSLEYGYRPVVTTKATADQELYEVVVGNTQGQTETYYTTSEHPFWVKDHGWRKASLLEAGMTLLDRHNEPIQVISQSLTSDIDTVFNIQVQDSETYHIGELGIWVHNADCCNVTQAIDNTAANTPAVSTVKGYTNSSKMDANGSSLSMSNMTPDQQAIMKDIMLNKDIGGTKTEALTSSLAQEAGYTELAGAKYGSNNGFDHVLQAPDGSVTIIVDSKQLSSSGAVQLGSSQAGTQLSEAHIRATLANLPDASPAKQAILSALDNQTLKTAVAGVDKKTGQFMITPVYVPPSVK